MTDGIVLDDVTAPLVPEGCRFEVRSHNGAASFGYRGLARVGQTLTHVGGRLVGGVVADVDALRTEALAMRAVSDACPDEVDLRANADRLDAIADRMLAPQLVRAWHEQQPTCHGGDPACPCQDGDSCHYVDAPGSPAMPIPGSES